MKSSTAFLLGLVGVLGIRLAIVTHYWGEAVEAVEELTKVVKSARAMVEGLVEERDQIDLECTFWESEYAMLSESKNS